MNASGALRPFGLWLRELARFLGFGRRAGVRVARTTAKSGAGETARTLSKAANGDVAVNDVLSEELEEATPQGFEAILFQQLPRPRLTERSASDLTIEEASKYAKQAERFYDFDFALFAPDDFFYEEVEEQFLTEALGGNDESIDKRFLDVMKLFRRTLNDNTRAMLLFFTPLIYIMSLVGGAYMAINGVGVDLIESAGLNRPEAFPLIAIAIAALAGVFVVFLLFSWPFKVVQQRNLMNLDNYLTSKFARINHNFQVAKRRALNVERDKRMGQREDLKAEAGAWTLSYHWFAMRLLLCEMMIRNKFYQVRRNTTLYWAGGITLALFALGGLTAIGVANSAPRDLLLSFVGIGAVALFCIALILRRVSPMFLGVMEANEWSRFHLINLHKTIADHVGEDKVQIVTFRDRNRFE